MQASQVKKQLPNLLSQYTEVDESMYLYVDKYTTYLECHFAFKKGMAKLDLPNKNLLLFFRLPHDDFVMVFKDVTYIKIVTKEFKLDW